MPSPDPTTPTTAVQAGAMYLTRTTNVHGIPAGWFAFAVITSLVVGVVVTFLVYRAHLAAVAQRTTE